MENDPDPGASQKAAHRREVLHTLGEEIAHAVSHGVGIVASIVGLAVLVGFSVLHGDHWHVVASGIFGGTLIILYTASTLYHSVTHPEAKHVLRIIDHSSIYLLIAGTYTPFLLITFRETFGLPLFVGIWVLAFAGVAFKIFATGKFEKLSAAIYLAMGWIVLLVIKPFLELVPTGGIWLTVLGGVAYTGGVVFFLWDRLPYNHAIWHGFVLLGSILHYFAVLFFVIPRA